MNDLTTGSSILKPKLIDVSYITDNYNKYKDLISKELNSNGTKFYNLSKKEIEEKHFWKEIKDVFTPSQTKIKDVTSWEELKNTFKRIYVHLRQAILQKPTCVKVCSCCKQLIPQELPSFTITHDITSVDMSSTEINETVICIGCLMDLCQSATEQIHNEGNQEVFDRFICDRFVRQL